MGAMTQQRIEQLEAKIGPLRDATIAGPADSIGTAEIADDAVTTLKINDGAVTGPKVADGALTGGHAFEVADGNVVGGLLVMHRILLASGADADVDVALAEKTRIVDVIVVLKGAGTTGSDVQVQNVTTAITDLIDVSSGSDEDVFRPASIDDAQQEIAAAANLRVAYSSTSADFPGAEVYVTGMKVA